MMPELNVENIIKLLYLRAIFKEDKEHVYEFDKIFHQLEDGPKYAQFYQKLAKELT